MLPPVCVCTGQRRTAVVSAAATGSGDVIIFIIIVIVVTSLPTAASIDSELISAARSLTDTSDGSRLRLR